MRSLPRLLPFAVLGVFATTMTGCASSSAPDASGTAATAPSAGELEARLARVLSGTFSSAAQHAEDSENYFDIRLVCVPIWEDRTDGKWLYIEQAIAAAPQRPYRQRIYHITSDGAETVSEVYTLPGDDPLEFAGSYEDPGAFSAYEPGDLSEREGCAVYLTYDHETGEFVGGTRGEGCSSALGDAAYATSEMVLTEDLLITWDRGWTAEGEQAWGATGGGYRFVRVPNAF